MTKYVMYINTNAIISMKEYDDYLFTQPSVLAKNGLPGDVKFTEIKYNSGEGVIKIIALGSPEEILHRG